MTEKLHKDYMTAELCQFLITIYGLMSPVYPFALAAVGTNNPTLGIHTGAGDFVWKCYTKFHHADSLRYEHDLLRWLERQGLSFTVPAPVLTHTQGTLVATDAGWGALFPLAAGQRPLYNDPTQIELVGAGLGELHGVLARYPHTPRPGLWGYNALTRVHPLILDPFALTSAHLGLADIEPQHSLLAWWRAEVTAVRDWAATHYATLPHQVIHGDFGPGNTLCAAGRLTAILDFEMALPNARAMDVAAGLAFSLRPWENPQPLVMQRSFLRGYGRWTQLSLAEIAALPRLMALRNAVSIIWRLGRALAAGEPVSLARLEEARWFSQWLQNNEQALIEQALAYCKPSRSCP